MPILNGRATRATVTRTDRLPRFAGSPRFATVVLDVDSTLCGIEGFDWLAQRRGELVARRIALLTDEAMRGVTPLEEIYRARLAILRPRRDEVDALSRAYVDALAPGTVGMLAQLRRSGVHVVLISSGLRHALVRLSFHLGTDLEDLHAVDIWFDAVGAYAGFDSSSVLSTTDGKAVTLSRLRLDGPVLAVGDAITDLADYTISSFTDLASLVLG